MNNPGPSLVGRVLAAVITVLVVAAAARLAWELLSPLTGPLIVASTLLGILWLMLRRFRGW